MKSALLLNQAKTLYPWPIMSVVPPYVPDHTQRQNKITFVVTHNQDTVRRNLQLIVDGAIGTLRSVQFVTGEVNYQLSVKTVTQDSFDDRYGYDTRIGALLLRPLNTPIPDCDCQGINLDVSLHLCDVLTGEILYIDNSIEPKVCAYFSTYEKYEDIISEAIPDGYNISISTQNGPYNLIKPWWITIYIDIPILTHIPPTNPEPEPTPDPDAPGDLDHN